MNDDEMKERAPVSGFARSFLSSNPIKDATITILENGMQFKTDDDGRFGPFLWPVSKCITLQLEKEKFQTTQTATIIVPPQGLNTPDSNISFQVPSDFAINLLALAMGIRYNRQLCTVAATITAQGKTLDDLPQGEEGAEVFLIPDLNIKPFYFDIFKRGILKNQTNPFTRHLKKTSLDGGVAFINIPPREKPYIMKAVKSNVVFNAVTFIAREGILVNLSPPHGPMVKKSWSEDVSYTMMGGQLDLEQ